MQRVESPEPVPSRYVVGIDLGTTNTAVTYADTANSSRRIDVFPVPQLVAPGQVETHDSIPSFHYQPAASEFSDAALRLPWNVETPTYVVGRFARDHGALVPGRLITSAKSWLCHSGVDRTAGLLPWHGAPDVDRLSPVDVSARYLTHIRDAWDACHPAAPLADQDVVLTLPASFDEVARELTVRAARQAGLPRVVLIEEPQAAFYAWIYVHADDWQQRIAAGHKILVCDIGGGTSDFTLIRVRAGSDQLQLHRVAVGDHLILGGDNLDLALAHHIERRLLGDDKFETRHWETLLGRCRHAKETLLSETAPACLTVSLPGSGARLLGGARRIELCRAEVEELLLEGFFPHVPLSTRPAARQSGFQEFGLPYAPDAAVTRHLAAFLTAHRHVAEEEDAPANPDDDPARPDIVLFNGGLFAAPVLRQRVLDVLASWFRTAESGTAWEPVVLAGDRLDLAVARGATYYGMVRRGDGVRIAADLARTYYVGVESDRPEAVCLIPASAAAGRDVDLVERRFQLTIAQPVEFPLYVSSTRLTDRPGELLRIDREQMTALAPIRTVLHAGKKDASTTVAVDLHARLSEIGTLDLWCSQVDHRRSWRMQFDVRSTTQTDRQSHDGLAEREGFVDEATWDACRVLIEKTFGPAGTDKPAGLVRRLAAAIQSGREQWPTSLLRRIWETLMQHADGRRRSQAHERRWLNLLGFALRPGFGLAVDDWRVDQTWRTVRGKLVHGSAACLSESWILWRRIGGGLSAGQQQAVAGPLLGPVRGLHRRLTAGGGRGSDTAFEPHESAEAWRLLGALELLDVATKIELGQMILDLLQKRKMQPVRPAMTWALGRLATRVPVYGPLNTVVPVECIADWLPRLLSADRADSTRFLAVMQMARRTNDRYRDLPEELHRTVLDWLDVHGARAHLIELVRDGGTLDREEQGSVFGEALPKGLRIA